MGRFFFAVYVMVALWVVLKDIQAPLSFPDHYGVIFG
jgi:hypothetical protein